MNKKPYTILDINDVLGDRHPLETKPGETRYFKFGENGLVIRVSGTESGGHSFEKKDGESWSVADNIISGIMNGSPIEEIDKP